LLPGTENILPGTPGGPSSKKIMQSYCFILKQSKTNYTTNKST